MRIEVTDRTVRGRCEIQTRRCHARACGVLGTVTTPDGARINVCGACLSTMAGDGLWTIPGTRRQPNRRLLDPGNRYTPNADALAVEPMLAVNRGRCEVQTEVCEAREWGMITVVAMPDCRDVWLCGACLERRAASGEWDLGWAGGAAVAEVKRLAQLEAAAPAA